MTARSAGDNSWSLAIEINTGTGGPVPRGFECFSHIKKMLGRTDTRTHERMYCQTIRTVRDISRVDRARIATCSFRTPTDRLDENYSIDTWVKHFIFPPSPHPSIFSFVFLAFFFLPSPARFCPHNLYPDISHDRTISTLTICPNLSTFSVPLMCSVLISSFQGKPLHCHFWYSCLFGIAAVTSRYTNHPNIIRSMFTGAPRSHSIPLIFLPPFHPACTLFSRMFESVKSVDYVVAIPET